MGFFNKIFGSVTSKSEELTTSNVEDAEIIEYSDDSSYLPVQVQAERDIQLLQQGGALAHKMVDAYMESKRINANTKALQAVTSAQLRAMAMRYQAYHETLTAVFGERQQALAVYYKALDKALESNDREMILGALQGVSAIVTKSPLQEIANIVKQLEGPSNQPLQLDF